MYFLFQDFFLNAALGFITGREYNAVIDQKKINQWPSNEGRTVVAPASSNMMQAPESLANNTRADCMKPKLHIKEQIEELDL